MTNLKKLKDKNILYITHSYNTFVKFQIEELSHYFNHVYVLFRHKPITDLAKIIPYPELRFHSKEYKMDNHDIPANITVIPTPVWYLPFDFFYRRLGDWHLNAVLKVIKKENIKFDLIHGHMVWSAGFVAKKLSEIYKKPYIITGHGSDIYKNPFKDRDWRMKTVEVLKSADAIITVSQNNLRKIRELGIKSHVHIIPNGFDIRKYATNISKDTLRKQLSLPKNKKIFLTVANLEMVKAHDVLLESIENTVKVNKSVYFVFVGGGSQYLKIQREIKEKGLEKYVRMTNFQSHEIVEKYQLASDFFILPSRNEGVPTVMFEALGAGLPFIGTKVGGIPEINREFTGVLVEPDDALALSNAITEALNKKWNLKKIKEYSLDYSWQNICKRIADIYEKLC